MKGWKYLALSTVMALGMSAGLAGCPEDEEAGGQCPDEGEQCVDSEDCSTGACDTGCGLCFTSCSSDTDCGDGQVCGPVCASSTAKTCQPASCLGGGGGGDGGGGGSGGDGGSECEVHEDCVEVAGYCSIEDTCVSNECGSQVNDCAQCAKGPDSGARGEDGPVVYAPEQRDLNMGDQAVQCRKDDNCGANNFICGFSASYYAAPGQMITSANAYSEKIFLVLDSSRSCTSDGQCTGAGGKCRAGVCVSNTYQNVSLSGGTVSWEGCYGAQMTNVGGVLLLLDDAGNYSNALCFSGTTP